ncbi:spermatogenesis-associated protein 32 isoform X2 [Saccopteryx leptura]|uniref:spermatogenesis-associated protein 32 isoform X2 n=1 Tax=Saccopteryx leptura TaxID=249018 RepID=UPI00339CA21A
MGVTGAYGFPCCSKNSVDILDTQVDINQHLQQEQQEEKIKENKLQELEPPQKLNLDLDTDLELEMEADAKDVPPLEWCPEPMLKPEDLYTDLELEMEADAKDVPPWECPEPMLKPEDLDTELGLELEADAKDVPPWECPEPMLKPEAKLEANLKACNEDLEEQRCKIESIYPSTEELMKQDTCQRSVRSNSSSSIFMKEEQGSAFQQSIHVQTSKHLFWADKHTQASEQSLQWTSSMQPGEKTTDKTTNGLNRESASMDTLCSEKQHQNPSPQPEFSDSGPEQPPSTHSSSSSLPAVLGLEDLVKFASSLALASSSNMDLPKLEHIMKAPPSKTVEPSTMPVVGSVLPPAKEDSEQENLSELLEKPPKKLPEAREPQKACKQEDKNLLDPYLDFNKPEFQRATIEGTVKFLQPLGMSSAPKGDGKESVPGKEKGSPILMKIHLKLLPPLPQRSD